MDGQQSQQEQRQQQYGDLEHGNMVFARLYDGKNAGNEASVKVEDGDDPENATITGLPTEAISEGDKITATVVHIDNQSGVKIADCKWKFTTSQDTKLGTEATSYAGDMSGSFTSESENIECTANTAGTYWLHVLTVDKGGNAVETISVTSVTVNQAGISAGDIANDDEAFKKVAGGVVTNYTDGQDIEWKVFYADTNGIYLIASDYVPVSKLTSQQSTLGFTTNGSYNIYWSSSSSFKATSIDSTVASRFMLNKLSTFSTGNNNYKMTACLIDATKWNTFRDARWVDENDIIGGPTLEMYVASWNKKYPSNKLYTRADSTGHYVGTSANPTSTYIKMSGTPGYSDTLYYPHTSQWNSCNGYWLASPSAHGPDIELGVYCNGDVSNSTYTYTYLGVRPVVHLKYGVKLKEVEGGYELLEPEFDAIDIANDYETFKKVAGGVVTNYSDDSGTNTEWKVFYADTNGIYLIASDYVPVSKLTEQQSTLGFLTSGTYNIYWKNSSNSFKVTTIDTTGDNPVTKRFMLNEVSNFNASYTNYKMTACLIDATKWNTFRDQRWVNENDIIGSPTLEMWIASWNKKYPSNRAYTAVGGRGAGYYVGTSANPTTDGVDMSSTPGYSDTLYFPYTSTWSGCAGYRLASPWNGGEGNTGRVVRCRLREPKLR